MINNTNQLKIKDLVSIKYRNSIFVNKIDTEIRFVYVLKIIDQYSFSGRYYCVENNNVIKEAIYPLDIRKLYDMNIVSSNLKKYQVKDKIINYYQNLIFQ